MINYTYCLKVCKWRLLQFYLRWFDPLPGGKKMKDQTRRVAAGIEKFLSEQISSGSLSEEKTESLQGIPNHTYMSFNTLDSCFAVYPGRL